MNDQEYQDEIKNQLVAFGRACALVYKGAYNEMVHPATSDAECQAVGLEAIRTFTAKVQEFPELIVLEPIRINALPR